MKAGIGHLQDKLESFREELGGKSYILGDETVAEVLRECEICFNALHKRIKAAEDEAKRSHIFGSPGTPAMRPMSLSRGDFGGSGGSNDILGSNEIDETASKMNTLRPFNQRIDLVIGEDGNVGGSNSLFGYGGGMFGTEDDNNSVGDIDDEELTRDKVKRASSQILQAMDKKKKKPKKKAGMGAIATATLSGERGSGGGTADDDSVGNNKKY
jgi:hypothetical protein